VVDAELGEFVARRLAAIIRPALDDAMAKVDAILARIEELKGRLVRIEEHYRTCPSVKAREDIQ
jgi:hypothetical protein